MKINTLTIFLLTATFNGLVAQEHIFTNVTAQMGISGQTGLGHSVGWCDIDNDLDLDLAISNQDGSGFWLYRNDITSFTNITSQAGLSGQGANKILWTEVTNDNFTDLIINGKLFQNDGDGTFTNITGGSGVSGHIYSAADFNKDGFNDLLRLSPNVSILFNDGDNTFTSSQIESSDYWAVATLDYNSDGYIDIYLGTYSDSPNKLYKNNGDGSFEDVTNEANASYTGAAHGLTSGDYNNDGFPDIYIGSYGNLSCRLLENNGDGTFSNATSATGTAGHNDTRTVTFADYNNDGFLDIFSSHHNFYSYSNTLLRNNGDGSFTNVAVEMGISGEMIGDYFGVGWGDYNNDGAIDLFAAGHIDKYRLFKNTNCPGNFLNLNLIGSQSTYNAVGVKGVVWIDGNATTRWVSGGEGRHDFNNFNLHFGLAENSLIDSLIISWPSGIVQKLFDVVANQFLNISEEAAPLEMNITAFPGTEICQGDSTQLIGIPTGGMGNYSYLWEPASGLSDPNISNPMASPEESTIYTCSVSDGSTSTLDSIGITVVICTGIQDDLQNISFDIFPNPVKNQLTINPQSFNQGLIITLNTIEGKTLKKVLSEGEKEIQINMASLKNGIYFLTIYNNKGGVLLSKKIIKSRKIQ